jgi:hypothetical protein
MHAELPSAVIESRRFSDKLPPRSIPDRVESKVTMNRLNLVVLVACAALVACAKKPDDSATPPADTAAPANESAAPAAASATSVPSAEPTQEQLERAKKQAALDYATMEDSYLNDAHGQWAKEVTASSTFGDDNSGGASDVNKPKNMVGKPDGRFWTNNHQDMGFDSVEGTFEKPVHATEVRAVIGDGVSTVSKLELRDGDGKYTTVWSGLNEDKRDDRGPRQWFVRKFDKSAEPVDGVKITFANAMDRVYKTVDAVQLVGE